MELPGPGTIFVSQELRFRRPVKIGDTVTVELEVSDKQQRRKTVTLDCRAVNQDGAVVASGSAEVRPPTEKLTLPRPTLPSVSIDH
jgi:acyl dehydratase